MTRRDTSSVVVLVEVSGIRTVVIVVVQNCRQLTVRNRGTPTAASYPAILR